MKIRLLILLLASFIVLSVNCIAQNWTIIDTSITHTDASLNSAYFTDDTTGYVVGGWGWGAGVILKTIDAGNTWELKSVSNSLECVYFSSKDTGYAVGEGLTIMKTIDAGNTWTYQNGMVSSAYTAKSVVFINNDTGFVGLINGPGYAFLKTYDGGTTWINDISDTVQNFAFSKTSNAIYSIYGKLSKSTDKGVSWTDFLLPPNTNTANSLFFTNDSTGFATTVNIDVAAPCTSYGAMIKTIDGGQTWQETNYHCDWVMGLSFPSNEIGYMVGGYIPPTYAQKVWKTRDGGSTWQYSTFQLDTIYGGPIVCTDTNTCYVLTNKGVIVKTTNGGGVGIEENYRNNNIDFVIYPNPSTSQVTIEFELSETKNASIEIKNILGQTVRMISNNSFAKGINKVEIDLSEFSSGLYFVQLQSENKITSKKFIKE